VRKEVRRLVLYRFRRARAAYRDGRALVRKKSYESAINRFYYAAFYSARALLALKSLDSAKHKGVISLFHQHFVKPGFIDKERARALARSFERRLDSDYQDFVMIGRSEALHVQNDVNDFLRACHHFFKSGIPSMRQRGIGKEKS